MPNHVDEKHVRKILIKYMDFSWYKLYMFDKGQDECYFFTEQFYQSLKNIFDHIFHPYRSTIKELIGFVYLTKEKEK